MSSDEGWEDDDMADLFSFGNDAAAPPPTATPTLVIEEETGDEPPPPERNGSNDSILDMLEANAEPSVLGGEPSTATAMKDEDAQEILNWLDEEDTTTTPTAAATLTESSIPVTEETTAKDNVEPTEMTPPVKEEASPSPPKQDEHHVDFEAKPTIVDLPPPPPPQVIHFESLEDALESPKSTMEDLRKLFVDGGMKVDPKQRAALWCRTVCGKTLQEVESSSLADSFLKWQQEQQEAEDARSVYIRKESNILAERIVAGTASMSLDQAKRALCDVLLFHYQSSSNGDSSQNDVVDPLLPPVACTLLSAGISPAAASVMMTSIMPAFMPLLALTLEERWEAAKSLHTQFYLLACYHLPLLVFHLDRYAPGWYWPKKLDNDAKNNDESVTERGRNLESQGVVPQSWLISHLAGECGGTLMNPMWLLSLWDLILTSSNNSLRFFLALAVLEKDSDALLMLTGSELIEELHRIMEFKEGTTPEGFAIVAEEETSETEAGNEVQEWCDRARALWEASPRSVVSQLRTAEDDAVKMALEERQKVKEEEIQARLEAEAKAYREAAEAEKERKAEEARLRLSRARLVAYYRTHNPEKEGNIDKIMEVYAGRLDVLDAKLKAKYGVGFKPALKPKPISTTTSKLLSTMNTGLSSRRKPQTPVTEEKEKSEHPGDPDHQVAVKVSATEVLPVVCWTKEAAASRGVTALARGRYSDDDRVPLKYYLVDSRPEAMAQEQGRFPTAVAMSPEALLDPDRIQQNEEMFESLRGAVHICIMGEGFSAVPHLYGQKVTPKLQKAMDDDDSRTSLCALFFIKKGFPFVSVLDGGFVQAHAWLCREGPKRHLDASSVLVDYDESNSFFARLEKQHRTQQELANASVGEKTQHALQSILDSSMTTLTRNAQRVENLAANIDSQEGFFRDSYKKRIIPKHEGEEAAFVGDEAVEQLDPIEDAEEVAEEASFVNRFTSIRNAAAGSLRKPEIIGTDVDKKEESDGEGGEKTTPDGSKPKFGLAFAGLRNAADSLRKSEATTPTSASEGGEEEGDTEVESPSAATPMFRNPFAARRSVVPEKGEDADEKQDAAEETAEDPDLVDVSIAETTKQPGAFARFAKNNAPKRNPFARFGAKESGAAAESTETNNKPNRFGGINMNQLRLNVSNLRGGKAANSEEGAEQAEEKEVEESVAFDGESPTADSTPSASTGDDDNKAAESTSSADAVVEKV